MSKNILFLTEQTFKERTGASNAIDGKQLFPMIKVAGDMISMKLTRVKVGLHYIML